MLRISPPRSFITQSLGTSWQSIIGFELQNITCLTILQQNKFCAVTGNTCAEYYTNHRGISNSVCTSKPTVSIGNKYDVLAAMLLLNLKVNLSMHTSCRHKAGIRHSPTHFQAGSQFSEKRLLASSYPSVCPHRTTPLPLDGIS